MAQLTDFVTDEKAINEGMWIRVNPALYDDLDIFSRGFTDEFVDAQAARLRKARIDGDLTEGEALPNAMQRQINAGLLRDYLVLDVRNLNGPDGSPVSVADFTAKLGELSYTRLARACWEAASRVTARTAKANADAVGN